MRFHIGIFVSTFHIGIFVRTFHIGLSDNIGLSRMIVIFGLLRVSELGSYSLRDGMWQRQPLPAVDRS